MTGVEIRVVGDDEVDLRLDRWFSIHFPELNHGRLQKLLRKGQVRVDGRRAKAGLRLVAGAQVRVPPLGAPPAEKPREKPEPTISKADADLIQSLVLYKDQDAIALNKPPGLAVQGGTGTHRHIDGMLDALCFDAKEAPRLVHRLDRDTSGILLLGRTRAATAALGKSFRSRTTRKLYWAITVGVPETQSGRIDLPLAKLPGPAGERMVVDRAKGQSATTVYRVVERIGSRLAWVALWPWTGRTHQLRVHCAAIGCPILGDGKYGGADAFVTGHPVSRKVHLHARSLTVPHPSRKGDLSVTAPLPDHMMDTWSLFGLDPNDAEDPFADDMPS
jgi:23S rRNA pseudouridine955/2504/2580 synthase